MRGRVGPSTVPARHDDLRGGMRENKQRTHIEYSSSRSESRPSYSLCPYPRGFCFWLALLVRLFVHVPSTRNFRRSPSLEKFFRGRGLFWCVGIVLQEPPFVPPPLPVLNTRLKILRNSVVPVYRDATDLIAEVPFPSGASRRRRWSRAAVTTTYDTIDYLPLPLPTTYYRLLLLPTTDHLRPTTDYLLHTTDHPIHTTYKAAYRNYLVPTT